MDVSEGQPDEDRVTLEGIVSVKAALSARSRDIYLICIAKNRCDNKTRTLLQLGKSAGVRIRFLDRKQMDEWTRGTTHGGVLALAGPRKFVSFEDLLSGRSTPFIVMLDGIEDPYNFGYAVRALYAAGADGLVVRPRNWTAAAATVARASAGASELLPTALADSPRQAADFFRRKGLTIVVTAKRSGAISLFDADLSSPLFLLIGGERRGIQHSFIEQADMVLEVPYGRPFAPSLGTVSASSVIAFNIMRQRGQGLKTSRHR